MTTYEAGTKELVAIKQETDQDDFSTDEEHSKFITEKEKDAAAKNHSDPQAQEIGKTKQQKEMENFARTNKFSIFNILNSDRQRSHRTPYFARVLEGVRPVSAAVGGAGVTSADVARASCLSFDAGQEITGEISGTFDVRAFFPEKEQGPKLFLGFARV